MPKRILVVDDEKHIARLIVVNLQRAGYVVEAASNGLECLERVQAEPPDLIILYWMMPELDGYATLQKLKGDPQTADLPVIMLTAKTDDVSVYEGWRSGADCYLTKPFNPIELLGFVERIFDQIDDDGPLLA